MTATDTFDERLQDVLDAVVDQILIGKVVPIVGPALTLIRRDGQDVPLYQYLADRLIALLSPAAAASLADKGLSHVAARYSREGGNPYSKIYRILLDTPFEIASPLLQLAAIPQFKFLITTTIDPLLARAVDQSRGGNAATQELYYAPSASAKDLNTKAIAELAAPVVFHMFGQASPAYNEWVLTEEDQLEFVLQMPTKFSLLNNISDALKENNLLFIGCHFPEWITPFMVRNAKGQKLSMPRLSNQIEVLIDERMAEDDDLVVFRDFSSSTKIFPQRSVDFVAALCRSLAKIAPTAGAPPKPPSTSEVGRMKSGSIFISYIRTDEPAARRLRDFLASNNLDVWLDQTKLGPGDKWEPTIKSEIDDCSYFLPIISDSSRLLDGNHRVEWNMARSRVTRMADEIPFIIPVAIDGTPVEAPYIPTEFRAANWVRLPMGQGTPEFADNMKKLMRDYELRSKRPGR
jgi:hypothetical protein